MYTVRCGDETTSVEADSKQAARQAGAAELDASPKEVELVEYDYGVACDDIVSVTAYSDQEAREKAREKLVERAKEDPDSLRMHITNSVEA